MARVLVSDFEAIAKSSVSISMITRHLRRWELLESMHVRSCSMGCDEWWTISVGLLTVKLDHFFMADP